MTESAALLGVHGTVNIGSVSITDECAAELRSHDGRHATGTTDFELYISMFVPQSSCCFPLCLSLHGTCRALTQVYILVMHMIALQLPFHLTTVGPLAPYKSCVSHPCIARACTDSDPTIWYFIFFYFTIPKHGCNYVSLPWQGTVIQGRYKVGAVAKKKQKKDI